MLQNATYITRSDRRQSAGQKTSMALRVWFLKPAVPNHGHHNHARKGKVSAERFREVIEQPGAVSEAVYQPGRRPIEGFRNEGQRECAEEHQPGDNKVTPDFRNRQRRITMNEIGRHMKLAI